MEAKRAVKQTIAATKSAHYEDLYQKLSTREGEKAVYRLACARNAATKDIHIVKTIKDSNGMALQRENKICKCWGEYFHTLLNEENARDACDETPPVSGPIHAITKAEVNLTLRRMKNGKAVGPDGIPTEAWKACGTTGVIWLTVLFNRILESGKMPDAWRSSTIAPIYKKKGDVQQCSNYRGIKLLSHTMKLWERVIDARLRAASKVAPNQFGFTPGRSTTDAIFTLRILIEKHREKRQPLHFAFIDMEKAYDRVPRDLIWWALRKKRIPEQYVRIIQDMYSKAQAAVRTCYGKSAAFPVTVGVHQGSALSPYLFIAVLNVICEDLLEPAPWTMLYADDIVLGSRDQRDLERKLQKWKD
uniref:Reverse transcriptase domain-containing protein n=1 Tax=Plectus sambesii TaxID=2011161 RepID=A0A914VKP3_9BILA